MITVKQKGDFPMFRKNLQNINKKFKFETIDKYGRQGVDALSKATPVDTGLTAKSWYYEIERTHNSVTLSFHNSNIQNGVPISLILQYGHGTKNGGWVEGQDYINPALKPLFDEMVKNAWEEVKKT